MNARRAVSLGGLLWLAAAPVAAQISPGELARPHAALEGSANCTRCHDPRQAIPPGKCLACHTALAARIQAGAGLHARPDHRDCRLCHVDHQGRDFQLIWWGKAGREAFDHARTGWPLEGGHRGRACGDCHRSADATFLGLARDCAGCHQDPHAGQFAGTDCATCHDAAGWKPPARFDHAKSDFPLEGAHREIGCADCHAAGRFRGIAHASCKDCHADVHRGEFAPRDCAACHSPAAWKPASSFDHSSTDFPLEGRHRDLSCERCHAGGRRFAGAGSACADCHRDPHAARLGKDCAACHAPAGWRQVTAGRFDHARARFPLEGRHRGVECRSCHPEGRAMDAAPRACAGCHEDAHRGQLDARPGGPDCAACHDPAGFTPARFGLEEHARARFPLEGAHRAVPCDACHALERGLRRFRFPRLGCDGCHADPHRGETAGAAAECSGCHGVASWRRIDFEHAATGFALEGAHARAACAACHVRQGRLGFSGSPTGCADCHADAHGGQLAGADGKTSCERCHGSGSFHELRFDHEKMSRFPLGGGHRQVPCARCHPREPGEGGTRVRYRPLETACAACHG